MRTSVLILVAMVSFGAIAGPSSGAEGGSDVRRLERLLYALPVAGAPANRVSRLVLRLVQLRPAATARYYLTGVTRLSNEAGDARAQASKIELAVQKLLKKSGLPSSQIEKIAKKISFPHFPGQPDPPFYY